jgi:CheY-like chemotaxis protein
MQRTVLLVDDEPTIRKVLQRVLERAGFCVLIASNADEAIVAAAEHAGAIDLLVTDVVMPATDGTELARLLCERYPELRVLFVSGYPGGGVKGQSVPPSAEFLTKPFSPSALADKIASVLHK